MIWTSWCWLLAAILQITYFCQCGTLHVMLFLHISLDAHFVRSSWLKRLLEREIMDTYWHVLFRSRQIYVEGGYPESQPSPPNRVSNDRRAGSNTSPQPAKRWHLGSLNSGLPGGPGHGAHPDGEDQRTLLLNSGLFNMKSYKMFGNRLIRWSCFQDCWPKTVAFLTCGQVVLVSPNSPIKNHHKSTLSMPCVPEAWLGEGETAGYPSWNPAEDGRTCNSRKRQHT